MNLMSLTAVELGKEIKAKKVTVREAVMAALDQIESLDGTYNSYVTVDREGALKRADEVQKLIDWTARWQVCLWQLRIICVPKIC